MLRVSRESALTIDSMVKCVPDGNLNRVEGILVAYVYVTCWLDETLDVASDVLCWL
jgi:hypothetical protein